MEFDMLVIVIWFLLRVLTNDGDLENRKGISARRGGRTYDVMANGVCVIV